MGCAITFMNPFEQNVAQRVRRAHRSIGRGDVERAVAFRKRLDSDANELDAEDR